MARRHLTPPTGIPLPGAPMARRDGPRREVSDRVTFRRGETEFSGWALNISRGGLRAIVEDPVDLGQTFDIEVGSEAARPGRIVWIQDEPDGAIVGIMFLDVPDASQPPGPRSEPPPPPEGGAPPSRS